MILGLIVFGIIFIAKLFDAFPLQPVSYKSCILPFKIF